MKSRISNGGCRFCSTYRPAVVISRTSRPGGTFILAQIDNEWKLISWELREDRSHTIALLQSLWQGLSFQLFAFVSQTIARSNHRSVSLPGTSPLRPKLRIAVSYNVAAMLRALCLVVQVSCFQCAADLHLFAVAIIFLQLNDAKKLAEASIWCYSSPVVNHGND